MFSYSGIYIKTILLLAAVFLFLRKGTALIYSQLPHNVLRNKVEESIMIILIVHVILTASYYLIRYFVFGW